MHGDVMDMRVNPELIKDDLLKNGFIFNELNSKEDFIEGCKIFNIFPAVYFSPLKNGKDTSTNETYAIQRYMSTWNKVSFLQGLVMHF